MQTPIGSGKIPLARRQRGISGVEVSHSSASVCYRPLVSCKVQESNLYLLFMLRMASYGAYLSIMSTNHPGNVKAKPGEPHPERPKPPAKPSGFARTLEVSEADLERFKSRYGLM